MIIAELLGKIGFDVETHGLESINEKLEGIQHRVSFLAAAEVLKGLFELAEKFGGVGEQINNLALQAGLTAEEFQKLAFAAHQNGIGQEEMSGALGKLSRNLYAAKQGATPAIKAFEDLGISPEQIAGFQNGGQAIRAVADRIAQVEDPIRRQALTMQLLGRGSSRMIKLLARGGQAFDEYGERAEAMGAILSNEQVESLEQVEDAIEGISDTFKALTATMAAAVAPALTELSRKMGDFLVQNRQLIAQNIEQWAEKAAFVFGFVFEVIKNCTQAIGSFINKHPELVENLTKVYFAALLFGVGMHALEGVITLVLSPLRKFVSLLGVVPALLLGFSGAIAKLLEVMAPLIFNYLPSLALVLLDVSKAIQAMSAGTFALWLAGIVVAVVAIVSTFHDIWALLHGASIEDTWLYKIGEYIGGKLLASLNAVRRFLGMSELKASDFAVPKGASQSFATNAPSMLAMSSSDNAPSMAPQLGMMASNAISNLASISQPAAGSNVVSQYAMPDVRQDFRIDARATITVPPGMNGPEIEELIKRANEDKFQKMLRDAHQSLQTAVAQ